MILIKRKKGSSRTSAPVYLVLQNYNTAGQGGDANIILWDEVNGVYYVWELGGDDEARELLSAVQKARGHLE